MQHHFSTALQNTLQNTSQKHLLLHTKRPVILKPTFFFCLLSACFLSHALHASTHPSDQATQSEYLHEQDCDLLFDTTDEVFFDEFDDSIDIPARDPELSLNDIPFYTKVVLGYLYHEQLKPTYFLIVGWLSLLKNKIIR